MERLKLLLPIALLLFLPTEAHACWNDDEEEYGNYDLYVDNYLEGYDVIITSDYDYYYDDDNDDSSQDETWWHIEIVESNSDNNDEDPMGWDDNVDGAYVGKKTTVEKTKPSPTTYVIKGKDKTVIENTNLIMWKKQGSDMTCVPTAMEYAAIITENPQSEKNANFREEFANDYLQIYGIAIENKGLLKDNLIPFLEYEFNCSLIQSSASIYSAIDNGHPVLGTIESNSGGTWSLTEHEVTIIGYTEGKTSFICIDPADGNYKTISYWDLDAPIIEIKSKKKK